VATNPKVYEKMAFIFNYDEIGGFYDHQTPPVPPNTYDLLDGKSTVNPESELTPVVGLGLPMGLGFRVPLMIISPWTRGGFVNSQVFDHTSVIQFIEKRFPSVKCPNISPWRRTVSGDLLSMFDFESFDPVFPALPDTSDYRSKADAQCASLPAPVIPSTNQPVPVQEKGTKPSRPLAFHVEATARVTAAGMIDILITNLGGIGAYFQCQDIELLVSPPAWTFPQYPRKYTVESKKELSDSFPAKNTTKYAISLRGPDGFVRLWRGDYKQSLGLEADARLDQSQGSPQLMLTLVNGRASNAVFRVKDNAYGSTGPLNFVVALKSNQTVALKLSESLGFWYDFSVTNDGDPGFERRLMGRAHTGKPGISDPAMGAGIPW